MAFIGENDIPKDSIALILAWMYTSKTDGHKFMCNFYYGNKYTFWHVLKTAFPDLDIYTYEEVMSRYKNDLAFRDESADKIRKMLTEHRVGISATLLVYEDPADELIFEQDDTKLNMNLIDQIKNSNVETIYFTDLRARSNLGHIYRIFTKGQRLPESGAMDSVADTFTISADSYFGREIQGIILPSPSSNARRGEWRTPWFVEMHKQNPDITFDEGRAAMYRKAFAKYFK